jgi:hypothetical protein
MAVMITVLMIYVDACGHIDNFGQKYFVMIVLPVGLVADPVVHGFGAL